MIRENLIRELQYLWWNLLLAIGKKFRKIKRELSACHQFVKISHREKYPMYGNLSH